MPRAIDSKIVMDRTLTIRASVHDVERTLVLSIALVILVVFVFLRNVHATFIPSVAVPVSLIGTFGVMYLCHYSIDNLSLMALTISTGFVVDDAIVVIENITRYIEQGMSPDASVAKGRAGDRVHGSFDQHFTVRGVYPHSADGRHRGTAIPRIRGHPFGGDHGVAGDFTHHHADDVFAAAETRAPRRTRDGCIAPAKRASTGY